MTGRDIFLNILRAQIELLNLPESDKLCSALELADTELLRQWVKSADVAGAVTWATKGVSQ